jgi:flagellar basal body-associated protein FliL
MAEQTEPAAAAPRAKGGAMGWIIVGAVAVVSAGAGFAVPALLLGGSSAPAEHEPADGAHKTPAKATHDLEWTTVPFGEGVANLDDNRMTRYLRVKFALAVDKKDATIVQHVVEERKMLLKTWLIGYLQSKQVEDERGTAGFNRVRREIQDQFNQMLFPGDEEKIKEILFEEFNVQ